MEQEGNDGGRSRRRHDERLSRYQAKAPWRRIDRCRGGNAQKERRAREGLVRRSVVSCARLLARAGLTQGELARTIGLARSTLRSWVKAWQERERGCAPRGRRPRLASRAERAEVLLELSREGIGMSIRALLARFPDLARRELEELRARVAYVLRRRRRESLFELQWTRPLAVMAGDFSNTPCAIDGEHAKLALLRDLASSCQLVAMPSPSETSGEASLAFERAFAEHGAPLVVKLDNGSAFTAKAIGALLERHGVEVLHSPAYTPSYNGACEAGGGSMKLRAARIAAGEARAGAWTSDDVERARAQANALPARGRGRGPSRQEVVDRAAPITAEEREAFRASCRRHEAEVAAELGIAPGASPDPGSRAIIHRRARVRALIEHGYLVLRRGRLRPLKCRREPPDIS